MCSHWAAGTVPMLRRHPRGKMVQLYATGDCGGRLVSPLPVRSPYVTTQPSRPSTSQSTTSSPLNNEQPTERTDVKTTSHNFATFYLDIIRSRLRKHASLLSSAATLDLAEMGGRINKVTGYENIEKLKQKVADTGAASLVQIYL
jgi:hypothetical protein